MAIGTDSTCAITSVSLEIYCWGDNTSGSLGTTTVKESSRPMKIQGLSSVRKVAISSTSGTCALVSGTPDLQNQNGTLYCWGAGTTSPIYVGETRDIAAGTNFFCRTANNGYYCFDSFSNVDAVRTSSGFYRGWYPDKSWLVAGANQACGRNDTRYTPWNGFSCMGLFNQISWDSTVISNPPTYLPASNYLSYPGSLTLGSNFSCITSRSAEALCWGYNDRGQLGLGSADYDSHNQLQFVPLNGVASISASSEGKHTCAIAQGNVYCWGANDKGQLGDGTTTDKFSPTLTMPKVEQLLLTPSPVIPSLARLGSKVVANSGQWDSGVALSYQWLRDGVAISGANTPSYIPTQLDYQHVLGVQITGSLSGYISHTETSNTVLVGRGIFASTPNLSIGGISNLGAVLVSDVTDLDSGASVSYQWLRDGQVISGANSSTYTLQYADLNHQMSFRLSESKLGYETLSVESSKTGLVKKRFSRLVPPVVKGVQTVGSVLTTAVTPFGADAAYTYQWLRNGVAIQGASERMYLLTPADLGSSVSFRVCGSKLLFETTCLDSSSSVVGLGDLGRKPFVVLKFSSVKVGAVVTGNPGVWDSGVVLSYQWLRDGVAIPGETSLTYQVSADDRGHNLSFKVLAQKTGYTDIVKYSVAKLIP
ncbi:MAG: hypothetical protein EB055_00580 [Micrococcales bacterium]|nr:hypothetical protein [Micrococcales bacterium]